METILSNEDACLPAGISRRTTLAQALILACLVWLFYAKTVHYGFTTWDDVIYVTKNSVLDKPTLQNIRRIVVPGNPTGAHDGMSREMLYIPVTYLSYLAETAAFGKSPGVMHCTNVILHMLNVLLVYALCIRFIRKPWVAFAAAATFAVHPLQAEAVSWVMGRKDLLSASFAFGAILSYQQFLDSELKRWHKLSILLYGLAVFAKPSVIVLPAILVLLDHRKHGRLMGGEWGNKIPFLVIMILAYFLNYHMPKEAAAEGPSFSFRLLAVPWLIWHWGIHVVLLAEPVPIYAWPDESKSLLMALQGVPLLGATATLFLVAWKKKWTWLWQGMLAFAVAFLPAASVALSARRFYTADRYGYMPLAILFMLFALGVGGDKAWQKGYALVFSVWLIIAGVLLMPVVAMWGDSILVWNKVLEHSPRYALARFNRATTLAERGRYDEALSDFQLLLTQSPDDPQVYGNLAQLHMDQGHASKAARVLENAMLKAPDNVQLSLKLARAYEAMSQLSKAIPQYQLTLKLAPGNRDAIAGLTRTLKMYDEQQLLNNPKDLKALMNLGLIALQEDNPGQAVKYLRRASAIDSPHRIRVLCALARAYHRTGAHKSAESTLMKVIALRPQDPEVIRLKDELKSDKK